MRGDLPPRGIIYMYPRLRVGWPPRFVANLMEWPFGILQLGRLSCAGAIKALFQSRAIVPLRLCSFNESPGTSSDALDPQIGCPGKSGRRQEGIGTWAGLRGWERSGPMNIPPISGVSLVVAGAEASDLASPIPPSEVVVFYKRRPVPLDSHEK
jgi:hypothetical protein